MKISLKAARVNCEMTQNDVARALKVNPTTIMNWEKGRTYPTSDNLARLCELYKIGIDDIFLQRQFSLTEPEPALEAKDM